MVKLISPLHSILYCFLFTTWLSLCLILSTYVLSKSKLLEFKDTLHILNALIPLNITHSTPNKIVTMFTFDTRQLKSEMKNTKDDFPTLSSVYNYLYAKKWNYEFVYVTTDSKQSGVVVTSTEPSSCTSTSSAPESIANSMT